MKNAELWASYREYTLGLTENARKLGFAAAAICWFFKTPDNAFPRLILFALGAAVLYFLCDILQYLFGACLTRGWTRCEEKKRHKQGLSVENGEYKKPSWIDVPSYLLWWLKIAFIFFSFVFIGLQILELQRKQNPTTGSTTYSKPDAAERTMTNLETGIAPGEP